MPGGLTRYSQRSCFGVRLPSAASACQMDQGLQSTAPANQTQAEAPQRSPTVRIRQPFLSKFSMRRIQVRFGCAACIGCSAHFNSGPGREYWELSHVVQDLSVQECSFGSVVFTGRTVLNRRKLRSRDMSRSRLRRTVAGWQPMSPQCHAAPTELAQLDTVVTASMALLVKLWPVSLH